jgi:hypothetical protein
LFSFLEDDETPESIAKQVLDGIISQVTGGNLLIY